MDVSTFSADTIALASLIIALAGLIITLFAWLRQDMRSQGQRLDEAIKALGQRLDSRVDDLTSRVGDLASRVDDLATEVKALSERVSRIEGLLEGLWRPRPWPEHPPEQDTTPPRTGTDG